MKKKLPILIGVLCICIFAVLYAKVKKAHPIYNNDVDTGVYQSMGLLFNDTVVRQGFQCVEEHLDGFYLKTDVVGDCSNVTLVLTVLDGEDGQVLSENRVSAAGLKSRKLNYFPIEKIEGCNGKNLELCVTQENAETGSGVGLYIQPNETMSAYVDDQSAGGVLVMKHVAERFDLESFFVAGFFCCFVWAFLWFVYRLFR